MPILQKWIMQHERPYFYGGPARGADVAAWKQTYLAELAKAKRKEYVAFLLDLVKAFDTVPFDVLIEHGVVLSYCLWILRLCILVYTLERVLFIDVARSLSTPPGGLRLGRSLPLLNYGCS